MKKSGANIIGSFMVVAVVCLFPVSFSFSQVERPSKTSKAAELTEALTAVERSTKKHVEVLTDLLDKVPQEAKPSIEHAIAVSKRGRNIAVEAVELARTSDPLKKASLHTRYAEKRVADIQTMLSKGKPEFVETMVKDYEGAIDGAMNEIYKAKAQGSNVSGALKVVERSTKKHTEALTSLLVKVPEQAKPAIAHAIEASKRGRNRATDVLNRIQRGELPIGKPESVGRPEVVGKPEEDRDRPEGRGGSGGERRGRPGGGGGRGKGR